MKEYKRVYAVIHLDFIEDNMKAMKSNLAEGTKIIGVVKADGYGHGSVPIAETINPYVWGFAVATPEEGIILRNHGIKKPILILGITHASRFEDILRYQLRPTIFQEEKAKYLSELAVTSGTCASIHLALDTGMNRIGMSTEQASIKEVVNISKLPGIVIEGIFTHFAKADEKNKQAAGRQLDLYLDFFSQIQAAGINIPLRHCSNSAGIIDLKEAHLDAVRAGISIYGLYPSDEVDKQSVALKAGMELKSRITYLKTVDSETEISYGGTFRTIRQTIVATIPVGYGDGYPRNLSNKGSVLIRGKRAGILGRVCMDQLMVDVTHIPGVQEDDEVTLIGSDGEDQITVEELAAAGGGFHYEILCGISKRVPRVYIRDGQVIGTKDYFDDQYSDFT